MDKDIKAKINGILSKNGNRKLSIGELDMVTGGYSESDLTTEERNYYEKILKDYVDACFAGKSEEEIKEYEQLILDYDQKMREKYN